MQEAGLDQVSLPLDVTEVKKRAMALLQRFRDAFGGQITLLGLDGYDGKPRIQAEFIDETSLSITILRDCYELEDFDKPISGIAILAYEQAKTILAPLELSPYGI